VFCAVVQLENERLATPGNPTVFVPGKICVASEGFTEFGFYQSYRGTHVVAFRMEILEYYAVSGRFLNQVQSQIARV
jgi:hypothetical protein